MGVMFDLISYGGFVINFFFFYIFMVWFMGMGSMSVGRIRFVGIFKGIRRGGSFWVIFFSFMVFFVVVGFMYFRYRRVNRVF